MAWSPAGKAVAAVSAAGKRMAVCDVEGAAPRAVIDVDAGELMCAAWAGEERLHVAVVTGMPPHQRLAIRCYDAASGRLADERLDEPRENAATGVSADGRLLAVAGAENAVQV
ncbi:MAG TPA: WD40 repeat domain-containing protein, partial [Longimicrobium sp.]|nr:WD40 repeat domain-containing protein [Longimicrobium sp.]